MRITYAFIFYFSGVMIFITLLLGFLCIPFIRKMYFKFLRSTGIGNNQYFNAARYMVVIVILAIMMDAIYTYLTFKQNLDIHTQDMFVDNFQLIKVGQRDDYLIVYKKYRELYLAERNFLLTTSALFIYFVFRRFLIIFGKLVDVEADIQRQKQYQKDKVKSP